MTTMMMDSTSTSPLRRLAVLLLIATNVADASLDPSWGSSDAYYAYSQQYNLELPPTDAGVPESDTAASSDKSNQPQQQQQPPAASSDSSVSQHGGEGFVVSAQALFCQGGAGRALEEQQQQQSAPHSSFGAYFWEVDSDLEDEDEESDDDDDDDDNDGHSSMLSNASVNRARAYSNGETSASGGGGGSSYYSQQPSLTTSAVYSSSQSPPSTSSWGCSTRSSTTASSSQRKSSLERLLQVRGGSDASASETSPTTTAESPTVSSTPSAPTTTTTTVEPAVAAAVAATGLASIFGSEVVKRLFVSALVTFVFEGCIGHILEFLKIVMQTSPDPNATYGSVIADITREKGIGGLWDGFVPWGMVQAISKGAVFGLAHTTASKVLLPLADKGTIPLALALTLAGGIGGGFQGYVLSPTLLLKTRVMTNPVFREKMSLLKTTLLSFTIGFDVVRHEGLSTLMKGSNVFAMKRVFDWSTRYFFADLFEAAMVAYKKGQALTLAEKSAASLLGGVASTCCTLPLDVLVAKTQDAKKAGVKVSPVKLFSDELKEKGWSGLRQSYMRGFEARLAHVCLTVVVMKTMAPVVYSAIFAEG